MINQVSNNSSQKSSKGNNVNHEIAQVFSNKNIPSWIWIPIMVAESNGNPNAISNGPNHSVGLFQLNPVDGQGVGYTHQQLLNPVTNAKIASVAIYNAYQSCLLTNAKHLKFTTVTNATAQEMLICVAKNSGHEGLVPPYSNRLIDVYDTMRQGTKYDGWGLSKSLGGIVSGTAQSIGKDVANTFTSPEKDITNYISKHWLTWVLVIALVAVIIMLLYKGITG